MRSIYLRISTHSHVHDIYRLVNAVSAVAKKNNAKLYMTPIACCEAMVKYDLLDGLEITDDDKEAIAIEIEGFVKCSLG